MNFCILSTLLTLYFEFASGNLFSCDDNCKTCNRTDRVCAECISGAEVDA